MNSSLSYLFLLLVLILATVANASSIANPYHSFVPMSRASQRHLATSGRSTFSVPVPKQEQDCQTTTSSPSLPSPKLSISARGGATKPASQSPFKQIPPILAAAFFCAAIMYPVDLLRSLKMANVGSGKSTGQLVSEFHQTFGVSRLYSPP